jgi:hypothetical protein
MANPSKLNKPLTKDAIREPTLLVAVVFLTLVTVSISSGTKLHHPKPVEAVTRPQRKVLADIVQHILLISTLLGGRERS